MQKIESIRRFSERTGRTEDLWRDLEGSERDGLCADSTRNGSKKVVELEGRRGQVQ